MIPNITRGDRMTGLLAYLAGPGRANEHTEPHLVAGGEALMAWHDGGVLDRDSARALARYVDQPRRAFGVEVTGGHVWHCSLSLRADEGTLTDEKWRAIAQDFIRRMGFDDHEGTKTPCRWAAIRHGLSKAGNDHVHLVVNLVREDGTKAPIHNDFRRAQNAARGLELDHDLEPLESASVGRATRGYDPAEREAQARARARAKYERTRPEQAPVWEQLAAVEREELTCAQLAADQPRYQLAVTVRGAAAAAQDEAEFVRRLRRNNLIVRPRYAQGRTDVITGYSVAARPQYGERPIWYGGGQLARDLTLPRLRDGWPDTPAAATEAAAEWNAAARGRRVVATGREAREPDPVQWQQQATELTALVDRLTQVPLEDHHTWVSVAGHASGALAAWSNAVEPRPGNLAAAAEALSRSAQTYQRPRLTRAPGMHALAGTAMLCASLAKGGRGPVAQAVMMRQLIRLTEAVQEAVRAGGQLRQAQALAQDALMRLESVHARLPQPEKNENRLESSLDPHLVQVMAAARISHPIPPGAKTTSQPSQSSRPLRKLRPGQRKDFGR